MHTSMNAQLRQNGDIDTSFGTDGYLRPTGDLGRILTIALSKNDAITHATELNGQMSLDRALIDGTKDAGFNAQRWNFEEGDTSRPNRLLLQKLAGNEQDERIVIVGESLVEYEPSFYRYRPAVMRLLPNGSPDLVFGRRILPQPDDARPEFGVSTPTSDGCLQQDGKLLIVANYDTGSLAIHHSRLYRLTETGELDNQFGQGGFVEIRLQGKPSRVGSVQVQSNGNIVVAGRHEFGIATLARYLPSGELDGSFGDRGFIDIRIQSAAEKTQPPTHLVNNPSRLLVMADDRIVFTAHRRVSEKDQGLLMRLTADGQPDSSFNGGNLVCMDRDSMHVELATVAVQADGKIVVAGRGVNRDLPSNQIYGHKWRFLENGSLDPTFNSESVRGEFADIAIQTNGRILLAGSSGFAWSSRFPQITAFTG